jgi:LemA protein
MNFTSTFFNILNIDPLGLLLAIAVLVIFYMWYASIISKRNKMQEALSGVDIQLQKRSDLIPNILKIAKKFMEHETNLFSEVVRLREKLSADYNKNNSAEVKEHLAASAQLSGVMGGFMAKLENYPELKSNQNMLQAQQTYNEVEAEIAAARRFYNSAANALRNSIQIFPGNIIAKIAGVKMMPFYEAEASAKAAVDAGKFL